METARTCLTILIHYLFISLKIINIIIVAMFLSPLFICRVILKKNNSA